MSETAFKCGRCGGKGVLLIDINPDGDKENGASYIETPCDFCNGRRVLTKAQLITAPVDKRFEPDQFLPIPLPGAFRVYIGGDIFDRKMSSRQLFKLAQKALDMAMETQQFERERDEASSDKA